MNELVLVVKYLLIMVVKYFNFNHALEMNSMRKATYKCFDIRRKSMK